jgi:LuxR family maltose regulon positive regulatory protein
MPKRAFYTLTWSSSNQAYELYEGQEDDVLMLVPGNPAWSVWVSQISSFAFHGQNGSYTARKERKQRGGGYWYAYARVERKLTKRYLGRGTDLTLARLEQVAQAFWLDPQAALRQKESRESSRPRSASPPPLGENVFLPDYLSEVDAWSSEGTKRRCFRFDRLRAGAQHIVRHDSGIDGRKTEHESDAGGRTAKRISGLPTDLLLTTKLHVPHPRPHLVHRPRLLQRLQQGLEQTLILLSAPAGFGKSTLLADWLTACAIPAAWLSLEPQDNDPARFLSYLLAALQASDPQLGRTVQALLHPLQPAALESVLTFLINNLQARMDRDHEHVILVLDNYHVITNGSIHHALSFLLEHLPPQLHLVLVTREDPPLPLAQLRGRDDLLELRAAELRFTQQETATYLVEVMGLPLSAEECALLQARTEGWITGLHLAALSLLNHDDRASFIKAFSGSHHYVMDYLLEEVLSRQRKAVQDFLLQTALLERLCAPLCDAVRAQDDSQTLLDFLEQANLFLIPLDDKRQWYRYHHLFAEALRQRLQQTAPTLVPELHHRASRWYEQHGLFAEAISHALATPAPEEAARLIEQYGWAFIVGSHLQTLCGWFQALPESLVLTRPALGLLYALALMYTNHWEAASACLQTLERGIGLGEDMQEGRSLSTVLGLLKRLLAEAEASMRMHSVLEILLLLALALEVQGDCTGALAALGRALALVEPEGYLRLFLDEGPSMLALLHEAQRHGLAPGYVAKLLEAGSEWGVTDAKLHPHTRSLMEPLTVRERDVLRLVLDGASNREIACQLVLSVNTAKKHVLNICHKLNVQSRAQAIAKARTLHLL